MQRLWIIPAMLSAFILTYSFSAATPDVVSAMGVGVVFGLPLAALILIWFEDLATSSDMRRGRMRAARPLWERDMFDR